MQVVDGEMLLTLDTGQSEDGFYTLLNGYDFSDFDLRVKSGSSDFSGWADRVISCEHRNRLQWRLTS